MPFHRQTVDTYDRSSKALAAYFAGHGARTADIERALELAQKTAGARVVEIGCGDGRDAAEIVSRVAWYEGFDPSEGLLTLARNALPETTFKIGDALSYNYPKGLDVVYAFASLLHSDKNEVQAISRKVAGALRPGGVFYISLKERAAYTQELQRDEFGDRLFFFYNVPTLLDIAGKQFEKVYEAHQRLGHTDWFTLALKRL